MSKELDRQIKTALNETRLLILGVQVLLGFEFQSFFQDGFEDLSVASKSLTVAGLVLVILSTGLLVIPSMQHRLVEGGQSSIRLVTAASFYAGVALAPLAAGLGLAVYVVIGRHFGVAVGVASAMILAGLAWFGWFGLELLIGLKTGVKRMAESETPLATKIEQLLTEARVIIPGAQALFGFQFIAMLTSGFDRLPHSAKIIHAIALCLIAANVVLLMTPAALHRLSFGGEDSRSFLKMGSALVIAAPIFLAGGIAGELYVVMQKAFANEGSAVSAGIASFLLLMLLWYGLPLALRKRATRVIG
ncbi:MAG TPA: DUF6328 family protein [Bradyrhizobium sp.]|jgi:hypothetical protein|nr:DUF6328 family protein [Bradyrhizobium sp.]